MKTKSYLLTFPVIVFSFTLCFSQWTFDFFEVDANLFGLEFIDENNGIATADYQLFKTTDGGENWEIQDFSDQNLMMKDVSIVNENMVFVSGKKYISTTSEYLPTIFKSLDFGNSWDTTYLDGHYGLASVQFLDQQTGFCNSRKGEIYKTTNSGNSWELLTSETDFNFNPNSLHFYDALHGMAIGFLYDGSTSILLKTTDGGLIWEETIMNFPFLNSLFLRNDGKAFLCGSYGRLLRSDDFGINWTETQIGPNSHFSDIFFLDDQVGYISGYEYTINMGTNPTVYKSIDGGQTWQNFDIPDITNPNIGPSISAIECLSEELCYFGGGTSFILRYDENTSTSNHELISKSTLLQYPNPASDYINFTTSIENEMINSIELYSIEGKLIFKKNNIHESEIKFDLSGFSANHYLVKISTNKENYQRRFFKF